MEESTDSGNFEAAPSSYGGGNPMARMNDDLGYLHTFGCQTKQPDSDTFGVHANRLNGPIRNEHKYSTNKERDRLLCGEGAETCQIRMDSILKLKDSTRHLLCLLDEIQGHTGSKTMRPQVFNEAYQIKETFKTSRPPSANDEDDCSVYKRLTRKCHCLNNQEYNDFIIHFNECTKYFTSTLGEIIKNMRIVKKFLYMGGDYTKHALLFLNESGPISTHSLKPSLEITSEIAITELDEEIILETQGLTNTSHNEKVEITQGCAHADVCNVFDEKSIVNALISWPCVDTNFGDATTQALAASFLNRLVQLEEGRRYLKFSSKITSDIKKVVRTKASTIEEETLESLNTTLNVMHPPLTVNTNVSYYCKPVDEGFGNKTVSALLQYRQYMTLEEVFTHLDLLLNLSTNDIGKHELSSLLPALMVLFKQMLKEYDNSELNIIITNILNNVLSKGMIKMDLPRTLVMADTSTEPIHMKSVMIQIPPKRYVNLRTLNKSKILVDKKPNKFRQPSKPKVVGWESPPVINNLNKFNKSDKIPKEKKNSLIVVPLEERRYSHKSVYL